MWQTIRSSVFDRHTHDHAYAAIVLSGSYEEAGDQGRFKVDAGDTVLHERFEAHINRFSGSRAVVLNLAIPAGAFFLPGPARVTDPDSIVRLAEKNRAQAARSLLSSVVDRKPTAEDWTDELAAGLIANPSLSLSRWTESKGLKPWAVTRGFMRVFGVCPDAFRARTRSRHAWKTIVNSEEPLAQIASNLGFADQSHMTRSVRQLTGMAPQMCRKTANGFKTQRGVRL